MAKQGGQGDRLDLPSGWAWTKAEKSIEAKKFWNDNADIRARLMPRMQRMAATMTGGPFPPHEIGYVKNGVYMVKITKPNPGWRIWGFRNGSTIYVSHITKGTSTGDHDEQEQVTNDAKADFLSTNKAGKKNTGTQQVRVVQPQQAGRRRKRKRKP